VGATAFKDHTARCVDGSGRINVLSIKGHAPAKDLSPNLLGVVATFPTTTHQARIEPFTLTDAGFSRSDTTDSH
jgi:hypothetical protein